MYREFERTGEDEVISYSKKVSRHSPEHSMNTSVRRLTASPRFKQGTS
jgi:hypothetical protein